ncbi:MAG: hypothetical protein IKS52_10690 [Clostridia bacterium]|nr:hypothetical protein [Clostridia bacterium]
MTEAGVTNIRLYDIDNLVGETEKLKNIAAAFESAIEAANEAAEKKSQRAESAAEGAEERAQAASVKGNGKYSIERDAKGRQYVKAERQMITGSDPIKWRDQIMNYINKNIRRGKDVSFTGADGTVLTITQDTAGKARV